MSMAPTTPRDTKTALQLSRTRRFLQNIPTSPTPLSAMKPNLRPKEIFRILNGAISWGVLAYAPPLGAHFGAKHYLGR